MPGLNTHRARFSIALACAHAVGCSSEQPPGTSNVDSAIAGARAGSRDFAFLPIAVRKAIGKSDVSKFEEAEGVVLPVVPVEARHTTARTATLTLPARANGSVQLRDDFSGVTVRFAMRGASDVGVSIADGLAFYRAAWTGAPEFIAGMSGSR